VEETKGKEEEEKLGGGKRGEKEEGREVEVKEGLRLGLGLGFEGNREGMEEGKDGIEEEKEEGVTEEKEGGRRFRVVGEVEKDDSSEARGEREGWKLLLASLRSSSSLLMTLGLGALMLRLAGLVLRSKEGLKFRIIFFSSLSVEFRIIWRGEDGVFGLSSWVD
jgi:hypothetical protein